MTEYKTESEVESIIKQVLQDAGTNADVTVHSDTQDKNTTIRTVIFKSAISLINSSLIIDKVGNIGASTDRSILYKGSQVEATNQGELRYLFFEAKIDPNM